MNIFKDIFSPRTVVGLQLNDHHIRAVQVSNPSGNPSLEHMARIKIGEGENPADVLKNFWQREKFKSEAIITSLPASMATIREVDLPMKNVNKLEKIVKYQMEPYVPYPIDEMVVDFFPVRPGAPIMLTAIRKDALSDHLELFSSADLTPDRITLEDAALFYLYIQMVGTKNGSPVAIVHLKEAEAVFQVIHQGQLVFMRSLQNNEDSLDGLIESLGFYRLKYPDKPVGEMLITGNAASGNTLANSIESKTGVQTSLWQPFDQIKHGREHISSDLQAEMCVPLGLAVGFVKASPKALDFRKEEFSLKSAFGLKNMVVYSLAVILILLGLFTFNLYRRLSATEASYEVLNRKITSVLRETFPQNKTVIKGRELAQMKQQIAAEKKQYGWLDEVTAKEPVIEVLLVLTNTLAGYRNVKIDNVSIEGTRILMDGRALTFKTIDDLKGRLEQTGYFKTTRLMGAKMDSQDRMVRFSFLMEKKSDA